MSFSGRFGWDLRPNKISRLLESKRLAGQSVLDLTESNPTRAGFDYPVREILAALSDPRSLVYEATAAGASAAREAVSAYYAQRGYLVTSDRVLVTASTSEGYAFLFKLLTDPGDEVLVPRPSYPLFEFLASMESIRIAPYSLMYHAGWLVDMASVRAAVTHRTRGIVLVNPNNPTGSFIKPQELRALSQLCTEQSLVLIADEVFSDYAFDPGRERVSSLVDVDDVPVFTMSGLSKVAGLPQMKLGWIVAGGPPDWRQEALKKLELIADTYLSVGSPVQNAAGRLLLSGGGVQKAIRSRTRSNLDFLRDAVRAEPSCRVLDVEGGWYATVQVPRTMTEEEWVLSLLDEDNVLVQPGFFYDFESEAFLVLSLLSRPSAFRDGVQRLLARVGRTAT